MTEHLVHLILDIIEFLEQIEQLIIVVIEPSIMEIGNAQGIVGLGFIIVDLLMKVVDKKALNGHSHHEYQTNNESESVLFHRTPPIISVQHTLYNKLPAIRLILSGVAVGDVKIKSSGVLKKESWMPQ